jgi:hypothetical protein
MCALLDPEIKQWLDIGAQYLTAVGTVGAVIVALYLSRKDRLEKISVSAAIHYSPGPEQTLAESMRFYGLTATNVGFATSRCRTFAGASAYFEKRCSTQYHRGWGWTGPPNGLRRLCDAVIG